MTYIFILVTLLIVLGVAFKAYLAFSKLDAKYQELEKRCPVCLGTPCALKGTPRGPFISGAHIKR